MLKLIEFRHNHHPSEMRILGKFIQRGFSVLVFVFCLFLVGCNQPASSTPMGTFTPTLMPENLPISSSTATTDILTSTPISPAIPTSIQPTQITPKATITLKETRRPTPTQEMPDQEVMSPDGKWIAKMYEDFWHALNIQVIEVEDEGGEIVWTIPYQGRMPIGDPHPYMTLAGWAPDSNTLYFYYSWGFDGGWPTLFDGNDLQALDIETGELRDIIDGSRIAFVFFADMSKIAYTSGGQVGVYDVTTRDDRHVNIRSNSIFQAGDIHMSPSESGLLYKVQIDMDGNARAIYLDLATMKQTKLLEAIVEDFSFVGWTNEENPQYLRLKRDNDGKMYSEIIEVNKKTASMQVIGTPTPVP